MSRLEKKIRRAQRLKARKAAKKQYKDSRELGPCFRDDCGNNGDFKLHCRLCELVIQACTGHHSEGLSKLKAHLLREHSAKTVPRAMLAVLRGEDLG